VAWYGSLIGVCARALAMAASLVQASLIGGWLALASAAAAGPPAWQQDVFWISFWAGPEVPVAELDGRFAEIVEANFTGYLGNGPGTKAFPATPARVSAEITLCAKHGLRCVPHLCEVQCCSPLPPSVLPGNTSCIGLGQGDPDFWGFQLLDEPFDFAQVGNWTRQIASARPDALRFINLVGAGDWDFFKDVDDYASFVASFVSAVRPQVLSMDFYPVFSKQQPSFNEPPCGARDCRESKDLYGASLGVLRQAAESSPDGPIPFWNFFNVFPYNSAHGDPSEAMIRWQATTSLAYGASGVMYWCYWFCFGSLGGGLIIPRVRLIPRDLLLFVL
jgi:hypothetical protein